MTDRIIYLEWLRRRDPRLGRLVNHDEKSRRYAFIAPARVELHAVRHTRHVPVFDQGNLGSCFPPDTHVRMADGSERPIEDVRLGEHVVTAEGSTGRVVRTLLRDETGGLVRVSLWGHNHLRMTREHPILTARGYVEARDLRIGDEVALPKYLPFGYDEAEALYPSNYVSRRRLGMNELPKRIESTAAAGRLFGLWLAEGSADGTKVRWTFGSHEGDTLAPETASLCREVFGEKASVNIAQRQNGTWWVTLYGTAYNELFRVLGGGPGEAKRPHHALCSGSPEFLEAMLYGWLDGDGCYRKDGSREGVTISHAIALAMYDIAQGLGLHPVIDWRESPQNRYALVRKSKWTVTMSPGIGRCRQDDKHVWRKVRAIAVEDYVGPVYDLTVEGDHSYVAEGIGVHNCTGNAAVGCMATGLFYETIDAGDADWLELLDEDAAVACYSKATALDPWPGEWPPVDTGSDGLSVAKVLTAAGAISGYEHAFSLDDTLAALMERPLITGTVWLDSMFNPSPDGLVRPSGREAGGHEYVVDGYDPVRGWVWFCNSWGSGWGADGRFAMQTEDYEALLARDGDVTVFVPVTAPPPTPTPDPAEPIDNADTTLWTKVESWANRPALCGKSIRRALREWADTKGLV